MNLFIASTSKENIEDNLLKECSTLIEKIANIPNINLVFGAYNKGLMKTSFDAFSKNNKEVIGITTNFDKITCKDQKYTKEIAVESTSERFKKIYEESDILLFLPGGIGTLAELFSALEENRIHDKKKVIVYNCNFFFTTIIEELYNLYKKGFIDNPPSSYITIESDQEKIINMLKEEI